MNTLHALLARGGPVMIGILVLSVVLYTRCFGLVLLLVRLQRVLGRIRGASAPDATQAGHAQSDLQELFRQRRQTIAAMIAAAPLLGLLGTVGGMISTFENLARGGGEKSMEGLAAGISEALLNTEAGLLVAIPAVLLLAFAHRQSQKGLRHLLRIEHEALEARP